MLQEQQITSFAGWDRLYRVTSSLLKIESIGIARTLRRSALPEVPTLAPSLHCDQDPDPKGGPYTAACETDAIIDGLVEFMNDLFDPNEDQEEQPM